MTTMSENLAKRAVDRSANERQLEYEVEMRRIVEATYDYIEQTDNLEPSLRDILRSCGLSTQGFYRFFNSKDELMLVLFDDGRRRLVDYLEQRMNKVQPPEKKVRSWIEGVLTQASSSKAAARTRPFAIHEDRLAELFPEEQRQSVDLLISLLVEPLQQGSRAKADAQKNAEAIYRLTFAVLRGHLIQKTKPTPKDVDHVVTFCLNGSELTT